MIQTAKALVSMPILVILVPVLQVVAYTIFTIPWMAICILLAAGGDIVVDQVGLTDDDGAIEVNYKSFE